MVFARSWLKGSRGILVAAGVASLVAVTGPVSSASAIVGGIETAEPWIVQISGAPGYCSGFALNASWVVTAAHCPSVASVSYADANSGFSGGTVSADYAIDAPGADVKLMHLATPHPLAAYPALDFAYSARAGDAGVIYGVGWDHPGQQRRAAVSVVGPGPDRVGGAGVNVGGIDGSTQSGDSGGPLVIGGRIVGVASYNNLSTAIDAHGWYGLLGGSAAFFAQAGVGPESPSATTVVVPLASESVPTGVTVATGDRLQITSTGAGHYGTEGGDCAGVPTVGPSGSRTVGGVSCSVKYDAWAPLPSAPVGSLIGRIGDGPWFAIGASFSGAASSGGMLTLRANDTAVFDNDGSYQASIIR